MLKVLFVSHIGLGGGAGIYNQRLVRELINYFGNRNVHITGNYSGFECEGIQPVKDIYSNCFNSIKFPNYKGARIIWLLFFLFLGLFKSPKLILRLRKNRGLENFSLIIFTSSIQAIEAAIVQILYPDLKVCLFVQENMRLRGPLGGVSKRLIRSLNLVSITEDWSNIVDRHKFQCDIIRNPIEIDSSYREGLALTDCKWDIVYLGGGSRIKGFNWLCKFFSSLRVSKKVRIAMLGNYSKKDLRELYKSLKGAKDVEVDVIGHVSDAAPYLNNSKLLLLPIQAPHFCRPAVEAALLNRTFAVTDLDEISSFADEENCVRFRDFEDLNVHLEYLLNDTDALQELGSSNNRVLARQYSSQRFKKDVRQWLDTSFNGHKV